MATTGSFASPLSPHETAAGLVFRFNLYHLVDLLPGEELSFPVKSIVIENSSRNSPSPTLTDEQRKQIASEGPEPLTTKPVPKVDCKMLEIAKIIRSKNSGPFELTFDGCSLSRFLLSSSGR